MKTSIPVVGERIKCLRKALGWSAMRLACEANVGPATIYGLERGLTQYPSERSLQKIAIALKVPLSQLTNSDQATTPI